tara:strand:+ start:2593 stop:3183 length:591 start_codon:yes stop_codon:yes gene_type:complete
MASTRPNQTISNFKTAMSGGGARPNLFEVEITTLPGGIAWDSSNFKFMCKAAQLPGQTIASIDVPFRGRTFKVAGDRTIDAWTVTIINDENFEYRNAFESWTELIANLDTNLGATLPDAYMRNARVYQLGRGSRTSSTDSTGSENVVLKEYEFIDIFPTSVSPIDLSYDSSDTIEEFTVEFQVQSINVSGAGGANA